MLTDIVVDTNVLSHAGNPGEHLHGDALAFVSRLRSIATHLCVDEGFDTDEARNRSLIGGEYLRHLRSGTVGYALVVHLASLNRVKIVSAKVDPAISRKINQRVGKPRDRTFLRVTLNSDEGVLVSHDYADFPQNKRDTFCRPLGADVFSAAEVMPKIS